jgi:mono/diheme cytochrome c family protein
MSGRRGFCAIVVALSCLPGCRSRNVFRRLDFSWNRMQVQPRYDPYAGSRFFSDGKAMREPVLGTEPYSTTLVDAAIETGMSNGAYVSGFPLPVTSELVERGRAEFEIICAACHGAAGDGDSVVAGFMARKPPSFEERRLRELPNGRIYQVIGEGYGLMPAYGTHLDVRDRWAVVAFVRALERSRHAVARELPPDLAGELARSVP